MPTVVIRAPPHLVAFFANLEGIVEASGISLCVGAHELTRRETSSRKRTKQLFKIPLRDLPDWNEFVENLVLTVVPADLPTDQSLDFRVIEQSISATPPQF